MSFIFPPGRTQKDQTQSRLWFLAALFLILYAAILSLSAAVRLHSWEVNYPWEHWLSLLVWLACSIAIHRLSLDTLPERDPYLLPIAALLAGWGLLTIWRLDSEFGLRQTIWLGLSFLMLGFVIKSSNLLPLLRRYKYIWLTGGLLLTAATFILGTYPGGVGPRLWLGCCGIYLQPSEPLKLLLVIYLAAYLADRTVFITNLLSLLLPTFVLMLASLALLVAQRDLGTASLFIVIYSMIIYMASGKKRILVLSILMIFIAVVLGYKLFSVIQVRIDSWVNPWVNANGNAYQVIQSLLAVASGGTIGSGPGLGSPSVVPVAQSDFIFSAIAEETGLVGTFGLIILLGLLTARGLVITLRAVSNYQRFLAAGITINLLTQSLLIIAGNLRLLPLTGVTLPLVSYGGSSLVTSFLSIALLMLISNHVEEDTILQPNPQPYLITGGLCLLALAGISTVNFYWTIIRGNDLLQRPDNPRRAISDHFVSRGSILDRNNQPLAVTTGSAGDYQRKLLYPALGPIIGYSHPLYGQAGLEASLDSYLRGLEGNSSSSVILSQILYSQSPPGLDVRISLDTNAQALADTMLADRSGAVVLLNAQTGEILVMSSHPGYDPNELDANWNRWIKDPRSVFLNRATQGQYSPGAVLGPFLLASVLSQEVLPPLPSSSGLQFEGNNWNCALPERNSTWGEWISHGCPGAVNALAQRLHSDQFSQLIQQLALDRTPQIALPVAQASQVINQDSSIRQALGEGTLLVSPLQMALASSALSPPGKIPAPRIALAANTPQQGWLALQGSQPPSLISLTSRNEAAHLLQTKDLPQWEVMATAQSASGGLTWYLGGTLSDWKGAPLAIAIVLEENNPEFAQKLGRQLIKYMLVP